MKAGGAIPLAEPELSPASLQIPRKAWKKGRRSSENQSDRQHPIDYRDQKYVNYLDHSHNVGENTSSLFQDKEAFE